MYIVVVVLVHRIQIASFSGVVKQISFTSGMFSHLHPNLYNLIILCTLPHTLSDYFITNIYIYIYTYKKPLF